ncbi:MAG: iron(III) transport system substrate-binding protein [Alphaproteobacteria bacterium]|jgi:iron(III) transport system substrate-binding protein|nr:iron(III) transport system substrate-binding protein [Alphaproteobacteria bacterium]MEA2989409.1 iron(III) transport system substrate-binding protein [Alphaproteobacteria bacterium]
MAKPTWTAAFAFAASLAGSAAHAADAALIEAARKEGEVTWYSTQIISQLVRPVAAAFEKKYPGVKVRATRANASEVAVKILNESRAGRTQSDVFDGTTTVVTLKKEGYVLQWLPEAAKEYPPELQDPQGYWIANNLFIITPGYNTSLVPKGTEPKTYADLLNPKWRGKMAWNGFPTSSGVGGFVGTVLTDMGVEKGRAYLRELAKQNIAPLRGSAREVLDQAIAGEYAIALQIFNHHAVISKKKGAPVDWIKMEPATGTLSVLSVHKNAPHPNAAKLLADFIISKEGQQVFRDADYITSHPDIPALEPTLKPKEGGFRVQFFTPEQTEEQMAEWKKVSDEFFR